MGVRLVGADDVAAVADAGVEQDRHLRAHRADVPGRPEPRRHLVGMGGAELGPERARELDLVDPMIAADDHELHRVAVDDHRERLQQRAGRHPELGGDGIDRGHPGRGDERGSIEGGLERHRLRLGARHLHVGGVAGGHGDLVLPRRAGRHVLVRAAAAHHPDVGLDPVPLEAAAVHHPVVGDDVLLIGSFEPRRVAVEAVGVLHDELAGPEHAGARPRLVALLDLEVVEDQRQVAVGLDRGRDVGRDDLLVGHRQHQVGASAILELEQLLDAVSPGAPPQLGGLEHRHQHLLAADRVHLLADDLHDPLVDAIAGGQPRPQPRSDLPDQAGADHQLVRDRLGVGGRLALGGQEVGGQTRHFERQGYPRDRRTYVLRP